MPKKVLLWTLIFSLCLVAACGPSENTEQSASSQVSLGSEAAPTATPAPSSAGDALESPQTESAGDAVQPADQPAPQPAQAETTAFPGSSGQEQLNSFRAAIVLEIDGAQGESTGSQLTTQRQEYTLEVNRNPRQRHQLTSIKSQGGFQADSTSELFLVDDITYTRVSVPGSGDSWIGQRGLMGLSQFANPDVLLALPQTAACDPAPVQVNGISAIHCTFAKEDIQSDALIADSVRGEAWLAEDGGYLVKYLLEATGLQVKGRFEGFTRFDSYKISYELSDINGDITVNLPPEAQSATIVDLPPDPTGSGLVAPDGAEIVFNVPTSQVYFFTAEINAIADFHRGELTAAGWQEIPEESYVDNAHALLVFSNETGLLRVFAHQDVDGGYFVSMTLPYETPPPNGAVDAPAGNSEPGLAFPVLGDAVEVISMANTTSYYTAVPVVAVVEFYRAQLPALGWVENEATAFSDDKTGVLTFEKDKQTLMVTINVEDGRTSVGLFQTGQ